MLGSRIREAQFTGKYVRPPDKKVGQERIDSRKSDMSDSSAAR